MGAVTILDTTTQNPITLMGERAGICQNSDITSPEKNYKRGLDCLKSGHERVMEYVNIEMVLDGYSARVIREWYTHIGGGPTRLQSSTRYIDYRGFKFVIPKSIEENKDAYRLYSNVMTSISTTCRELEAYHGIPREDAALLLPLGMETKIVDKRNLRNLVDMSHQRLCSRAYHEYRRLMYDIMAALSNVSDEWKTLIDQYFQPKCEYLGRCPEKNSCGRKPKLTIGE